MKHLTLFGFVAAICASMAACVTAPPPAPGPLHPPAGEVLIKQLHASGVQIYECAAAKSDPAQFDWVFRGPEAKLVSKAGGIAGKHYAGPTWESTDGSRVVGEVIASSPSAKPNSIPQLLLRAKAASGNGIFAQVHFIQRLNTAGGQVPVPGCRKEQAGQQLRASYSADYLFYGVKR
jgi:hypothetical protein